jgi:hypothetical protein
MHFSVSYQQVWKERIVYLLIFSLCMVISSQFRNPYNIDTRGENQMMEQLKSDNAINEEKPPILGSWKKIYFAVLLNVIVLIILFYFFSEAFK